MDSEIKMIQYLSSQGTSSFACIQNSQQLGTNEPEAADSSSDLRDGDEFPRSAVTRLISEMGLLRNLNVISRTLPNIGKATPWPRMSAKVLEEMEFLLDSSILLCSKASGQQLSANCQEFFNGGLTVFFANLFMSTKNATWTLDIQQSCLKCCEKLIELIAHQISADCLPLLKLLLPMLDPNSQFNMPAGNSPQRNDGKKSLQSLTLIHLINHFGKVDGFQKLLERFQDERDLSFEVGSMLLLPFAKCLKLVSTTTVEQYFLPIGQILLKRLQIGENLTSGRIYILMQPFEHKQITIDVLVSYIKPIIASLCVILDNISDEERKTEGKSVGVQILHSIFRAVKSIHTDKEVLKAVVNMIDKLRWIRKDVTLRLLNYPFLMKLNGLIEINEMIKDQNLRSRTEMDFTEEMATWIHKNGVLKLALNVSTLNHSQYWKELEEIILYLVEKEQLTLKDLDGIWNAMDKCEDYVIVNRIDTLLVNLVPHLSSDKIDHLLSNGFQLF